MLVRVQARIKGWLQRRKYRIMLISSNVASKYFKTEEASESLRGKFNGEQKLRQDVFNYSTGAQYQGQWLGGLRHGFGQMMWPDGAKYEGEW